MRHLMKPMARLGVTPNMLTGLGFLLSLLTAVVIAQGFLFLGGVLVLLASVFDLLDGAMAHVQQTATIFGAFFDSTLDRYSESVILFGLLWYTLQRPANFRDGVWPASHEQAWMIAFIYLAIVGSLLVSYTKARAEGLGIACNGGLLARPERVVILALGLFSGASIWILAVLALFSNVTAVERILAVWRATHKAQHVYGSPTEQGLHVETQEHDSQHDICSVPLVGETDD
ncbi:MAG: CDP-alcohol phosphatidyltransferase family protein [Ktedonobacteraceae bacterium]